MIFNLLWGFLFQFRQINLVGTLPNAVGVQYSLIFIRHLPQMNYPDKIELVLTYKHDPDDTDIFTEKVKAERVGEYYKLVQVPAFAPNIAYGDIVKVEVDDGEFHFDELIEESGFSVVQIVIWKQESKYRIISTLDDLGCGVNTNVADNYLVISVPSQLLYQPILSFLLTEHSIENIDFRDCRSKVHASNL
ncbi:DUF4265 domain-containing protein [Flavitalea sp. BT771]|uniref:DUF4265 domain-containing protein n=1 Tax=Flavitalea sp. BT771 TaxID=3063329 RepID=UPI0026E49401|nr:DUF4265 domain-containing protein [Flavitalea sp. BT771]MDO6429787.1 DUF4265 domain-containing protein [Flavitalea sp. BT771]MDV6218085.1 DUF4265 domain-containing protein [Flavitalea sp. BT771]